jgi:hypothetical protein
VAATRRRASSNAIARRSITAGCADTRRFNGYYRAWPSVDEATRIGIREPPLFYATHTFISR